MSVSSKELVLDRKKVFPKAIYDNPAYEAIGQKGLEQLRLGHLKEAQKKDFESALQYAEKHILSVPIQEWTTDLLLWTVDLQGSESERSKEVLQTLLIFQTMIKNTKNPIADLISDYGVDVNIESTSESKPAKTAPA